MKRRALRDVAVVAATGFLVWVLSHGDLSAWEWPLFLTAACIYAYYVRDLIDVIEEWLKKRKHHDS